MNNYLLTIINHYNNISHQPEDLACELGYEIIQWGEDWLEYGFYQESLMIMYHTAMDFYVAIRRTRTEGPLGYEINDLMHYDIYEVEPKEVTVTKYFPVYTK